MFRTIFTLGAFALLGLLIYGIMSIFSPDTARRWRDKWSS